VLSYEKKLRNVTAIHAHEFKVDKSDKILVTVGESSIDSNSSISVSVIYAEEEEWRFMNCKGIIGRVVSVESMHDRKQVLALVNKPN
jgi:hypothetical protein